MTQVPPLPTPEPADHAARPVIIDIRNLTHRYKRQPAAAPAVHDLSLQVREGELLGFIGPNGAGKTTTMRILATLLRPTAGDAWIGGCSVRHDPRGVRRQIGYMPDLFGVYTGMKVWEYLDLFAACYDIGAGDHGAADHGTDAVSRTAVRRANAVRRAVIDDLLELVDLAHRRDDDVDDLSRGMKQRLCLARALIHEPRVLILDEPASGLDPRARIEIRELLRELQQIGARSGRPRTIVFSSHILLEVAEICTTVAIIEAGRLVTCGTMDEIRREGERRGSTRRVQITLTGARAQEAVAVLRDTPGVTEVHLARQGSRPEIWVYFQGDDSVQTHLLTRLMERGLPVVAFQEQQIQLEDVFMQVTKGIIP
jgi:ABC-2 type transport system ATP-binding protein